MADRHNRDIDRPAAPLPAPLDVMCVDAHAHLELVTNTAPDSPEIAAVIMQAKSVGIDRLVQVGYSAEQSLWGVQLADQWPGVVLAAVALHPNEAPRVVDLEKDLAIIEELALRPRVRAIGETGWIFSEHHRNFEIVRSTHSSVTSNWQKKLKRHWLFMTEMRIVRC